MQYSSVAESDVHENEEFLRCLETGIRSKWLEAIKRREDGWMTLLGITNHNRQKWIILNNSLYSRWFIYGRYRVRSTGWNNCRAWSGILNKEHEVQRVRYCILHHPYKDTSGVDICMDAHPTVTAFFPYMPPLLYNMYKYTQGVEASRQRATTFNVCLWRQIVTVYNNIMGRNIVQLSTEQTPLIYSIL